MTDDAIRVATWDYVTIPLAAACTGYSAKAIERKIEDGKWIEGREYIRAPDGKILVARQGFKAWAETVVVSKSGTKARAPSASASPTTASSTAER